MSPRRLPNDRAGISRPAVWVRCATTLFGLLLLAGCGDVSKARRAVNRTGAEIIRQETLSVCRESFARGGAQKIAETNWPVSARAFHLLGLWAEPDGAYLLIHSDADGERGVYLPRIFSEKDPLCSPALKHEKLAAGVYWYEKKR